MLAAVRYFIDLQSTNYLGNACPLAQPHLGFSQLADDRGGPHSRLSATFDEAGHQVVGRYSTRARSRSKLARPYIWRLMVLRRLTCPSSWPLLQGYFMAL